jgi:aspartate-semialdehyde dehydrogenase
MREKIPSAVLGATGAVGQRFLSLLADHPWFEVVSVTGSRRSQGKLYAEATQWVVPGDMPAAAASLTVRPSEEPGDVRLVFSALPSSPARQLEPSLAERGYAVCSNASAFRMTPDVPLMIPFINPEHHQLIEAQRRSRGWRGLLVTSPNCSTTGVVFPLKVLDEAFGVARVHVVTMQAISGAGYPGLSSFEIQDNVIPFIPGEEEKIENEPRKLLGALREGRVEPAGMIISAQANRVPVIDGHLAALSVALCRAASFEEVQSAFQGFNLSEELASLPSAPARPLILRDEPDRPQPRRDREAQNGMAVSVGRIRPCPVFDYRLISLVHNTLLGAAGGAILNAEWLTQRGYLGHFQ